jgi:peptidoglycan/LPS O-acetylase OafA/YrhL
MEGDQISIVSNKTVTSSFFPIVPNYISSLDGLRSVSVLAVIIYHCIPTYLVGGWVGVDIFFALSGFLITSRLLQEWRGSGTILLKQFYLRRMVRLMPALYAMLAFVVVVLLWYHAKSDSFGMVLVSAFSLMNWSRAFHWGYDGFLGHTWSLAIEEQFYLVWPLLFMVLVSIGGIKSVKITASTLALVCLGVRLVTFDGENFDRIYNGFDTRADSLIIGCFFACISSNLKSTVFRSQAYIPALFLLFVSLFVHYQDKWLYTWGWSVIALASAWLVYCLVMFRENNISRALQLSPLVYLGRISYGMYLWHYPIMFFLKSHLNSYLILTIMCLFLTIVVATISYNYLEQPLIKLWRSRSSKMSDLQLELKITDAVIPSKLEI